MNVDFHIVDAWHVTLLVDAPDKPLQATLKATQPSGYVQEIGQATVRRVDGRANVTFVYPLIDDGRFEPEEGVWSGNWILGDYRFELSLSSDGNEIKRSEHTFAVQSLYPRIMEKKEENTLCTLASTQLIESAARQCLYTHETEAVLLARIAQHRIHSGRVQIDVVKAGGDRPLAGPWTRELSHDFHYEHFSIDGWTDGEYAMRIRLMRNGEPVGPYGIRKFWIQRPIQTAAASPMTLQGQPEMVVDEAAFENVEGIRFAPVQLGAASSPIVESDQPHEEELLYIDSLKWNDSTNQYECFYRNAGHDNLREADHDKRADLRMLAASSDGETWHKPSLSQVEFDGNVHNNLLREQTEAAQEPDADLQFDIENATFRFYDAPRDGPVDVDRVFVCAGKGKFPFQCDSVKAAIESKQEGAFIPKAGEFWPMEKRGNEYLILATNPVLYLGVGMDLMHTTESLRCHVEVTDDGHKRLFYYFRPGAPAHLPHAAPYDNMFMCLRCLAVLWTDDGLTFHRRFIMGPDEHDPIGTQLYGIGLLHPLNASIEDGARSVINQPQAKLNQAVKQRNLHVGLCLVHFGLEQRQAPQLVWTRDFIQFHRFRAQRRNLIEPGSQDVFDHGMVRPYFAYVAAGEQWLHCYTGINTRHNGYIVLSQFEDVASYREKCWQHALAPYFETWDGLYAAGKATRYLPALAKGKAHRLALAEAIDGKGVLHTRPIRVQQPALRLNAATEPGGYIMIQIMNETGKIIADTRFEGDTIDTELTDMSEYIGSIVSVQFTLQNAQLFAFLL